MELDVEIPANALLTRPRHALAPQPEDAPVLGARRYRERERPLIRRGHPRLPTQDHPGPRHADLCVKIVPTSFEARIGLDRDHEIQIPWVAVARALTALTGD